MEIKSKFVGKEYNTLKKYDDTKELEGVEIYTDDGNLELTDEMLEKIEKGEAVIAKVDKEQLEAADKKLFKDDRLNKKYS